MATFKEKLELLKRKKKKDIPQETPEIMKESLEDIQRTALTEAGPRIMSEINTSVATSCDDTNKCIAILFMVRDKLPYEEIWRIWIKAATIAGFEVRVFCHSHHPEKIVSQWLKKRLIKQHFNTGWGSIELVKAAMALLKEALEIPLLKNGDSRFLYASESCLPVADPSLCFDVLFGSPRSNNSVFHRQSWLKASNRPNNGYSGQLQFDKMSMAIPSDGRWKADQWVLLTKAHAKACIQLCDTVQSSHQINMISLFKHTKAGDELFFPTVLSLLGELPCIDHACKLDASDSNDHDKLAPNICGKRLTYCDWSGHSPKSPADLVFNQETVEKALNEGCLFARKFKTFVDIELWFNLVLKPNPIFTDSLMCAEQEDDQEEEEERGAEEVDYQPVTDRKPHHADYAESMSQGRVDRDRGYRRRSRSRSGDRNTGSYHRRSRSGDTNKDTSHHHQNNSRSGDRGNSHRRSRSRSRDRGGGSHHRNW